MVVNFSIEYPAIPIYKDEETPKDVGLHCTLVYLGPQEFDEKIKAVLDYALEYFRTNPRPVNVKGEDLFGPNNDLPVHVLDESSILRDRYLYAGILQDEGITIPRDFGKWKPHVTIPEGMLLPEAYLLQTAQWTVWGKSD